MDNGSKVVIEGLLKDLERYLGPAMRHLPNVSKAQDWLVAEGERGKPNNLHQLGNDLPTQPL